MKPYGIVVCGGESTRMGKDKSLLTYHGMPQYAYVAQMLKHLSESVAISCNISQFQCEDIGYQKLYDLSEYSAHGPVSAVLTAFKHFPENDLLLVGCDYPLLAAKDLRDFLSAIEKDSLAAAFYNQHGKYEPVLAWYSRHVRPALETFCQSGEHSLQYFLNKINAQKYLPESENCMTSVDTPEEFEKICRLLSQKH
ncbi:molybdenum cofactor guanylyltransferase [Dyadobacter luticola]|uniref:Probable molybdenum cofactor guanylyltransferase n=1 Tax=Dyadobacter luticola TaxID=1979387 RepID=A0A5R9KSL1_9BACT|nr:molybdenum cofactor guanylyltransferase [Dyadobacter luticola]TLU99272.1 molybdenum cofactor guanylyltransferase [Dyadobacter luticola]